MAAIAARLRELANKAAVCTWVEVSGTRVWRRGGDLTGALAEAGRRGAFAELWLMEGAALAATEEACRAGREVGALREPAVGALPAASRGMLNAGLGLGLARQVLGELPPAASGKELAAAIVRFHTMCHRDATPGYAAAALQGLGFVGRVWHRRRLAAILAATQALEPDFDAYVWHAVGRAIYFLPRYFPPLPGGHARTLARVAAETPAGNARAQTLAGLVFAAALTNMRQPVALERLLRAALDAGADEEPLREGVRGACGVREDATPDSGLEAPLLAHRPHLLGEERWERLVRAPCRQALAELPAQQSEARLAELLVCRSEAVRLAAPGG